MVADKIKIFCVLLGSLIIAAILTIFPLPTWCNWIRPLWVILVMFYWSLVLPERVNVGSAFLVGIFLDVLFNVPFGENALALVVTTYFVATFATRIKLLTLWQQVLVFFSLLVLYQLLPFFMQSFTGQHNVFGMLMILTRAFVSALLWPWLAIILQLYQQLCNLENSD
jgi:rod shape-determining protein MreD